MSKNKFFKKYGEADFLKDEIERVETLIEEKLQLKNERVEIEKLREILDKRRDQLAKL